MKRHMTLWEDRIDGGRERCVLAERELSGTVLLLIDGVPSEFRYRVQVDHEWRTRAVEVERHGRDDARLVLHVDSEGCWSDAGTLRRDLDGCQDVDLEFSPSTNMLPLRRLGLAVGESAVVEAAWVRFPTLAVEHSAQTYTRLGPDRYEYRSGDFVAMLTQGTGGLVRDYGEIWRQLGEASGGFS